MISVNRGEGRFRDLPRDRMWRKKKEKAWWSRDQLATRQATGVKDILWTDKGMRREGLSLVGQTLKAGVKEFEGCGASLLPGSPGSSLLKWKTLPLALSRHGDHHLLPAAKLLPPSFAPSPQVRADFQQHRPQNFVKSSRWFQWIYVGVGERAILGFLVCFWSTFQFTHCHWNNFRIFAGSLPHSWRQLTRRRRPRILWASRK